MAEVLVNEPTAAANQTLGAELRLMRSACGFGLNEAAGRSQISKAALSQWESGARTPSGQALDRLLTTLRAEPRVRARLLAEADPAYARTELASEPMGSEIDLGQVLRGMRLRSRLTQSEVANLCFVSQSTIATWETGDNVPGAEALNTALRVLGASEDEIAIIHRSRHVRSNLETTSDISARLMQLHDPLVPFGIKEPMIVLLQRDAWQAALNNPAADEILCEITTWRSAWTKRAGRVDEAKLHARRALRHAKAIGNVEAAGFAVMYLTGAELYGRGPLEQAQLYSVASKWLDKPLSPFLRARLLCTLACGASLAGLIREGENLAREAVDLLKDYRSSSSVFPYTGVEEAIGLLSTCLLQRGHLDEAMETLQSIPDFDKRGYFDSQYTTEAFLWAFPDLDMEMPAEVLPAIRRIKEYEAEKSHYEDHWIYWERFLVRQEQEGKATLPYLPATLWRYDL